MSGSISKLVERMKYWCLDVSLGYDQYNREDFRNDGETDCSALVIHALKEAGFDTGSATYTGNMRSQLTARGWKVMPVNGSPKTGDILLNDVNHVAVYIGGGKLAQASIDENGHATGGKAGDQTGHETNVSYYYNYPWNCYLRYTGKQSAATSSEPASDGELEIDGQFGVATANKAMEYEGITPDDEISHQYKEACNEHLYAAQFDNSLKGSMLIKKWQTRLKAKGLYNGELDGLCGTGTIKAMQTALGTTVDGIISETSEMVKALQRALNANKLPW